MDDVGDFRWDEFIVLRDKPIPIILGGFREFLTALALIDPDRHRVFDAPHVGWPDVSLQALLARMLDP